MEVKVATSKRNNFHEIEQNIRVRVSKEEEDYLLSLDSNPRKSEISKYFDFHIFNKTLNEIYAKNPKNTLVFFEFVANAMERIVDMQNEFNDQETCSDILIGMQIATQKIRFQTGSDYHAYELVLPKEDDYGLVIASPYYNKALTIDVNHTFDFGNYANICDLTGEEIACYTGLDPDHLENYFECFATIIN